MTEAGNDRTVRFTGDLTDRMTVRSVLEKVYHALEEKGYNPVDQLVGYLLSGDPTYITSHQGARSSLGRLERHDVLEELVRQYVERAKEPTNP